MAKSHVALLLASLDEGFAGPAWHGPSLRGALRGITHRAAAARPGAGRHNIWEIALHAAYWKYAVRRRLLGENAHSDAYDGRNWFVRPHSSRQKSTASPKNAAPLELAWREDLALLSREHRELCATVAALRDSELDRASRGSRQTPRFMIEGIAMHDVYHAGQIQLLRRLISPR